MPQPYKYIFFDLDHTLWDFERNSDETKREMFQTLELINYGIDSYEIFKDRYLGINQALWALYRESKIEKAALNFHRFYDTLLSFGVDNPKLGKEMADYYIKGIISKTYLFPYTFELLDYLKPKYCLAIITNGFEEVQYHKLKNSGLESFFSHIITSEAAGCMKPDVRIFLHAMKICGAIPENSIMIGDDLEVDIGGARNAKIDQILVNHNGILHKDRITFEVSNLKEIEDIL